MKILFLTPPLKAWDSHGYHLAANQMHAQLAAYVREKKLGEPFVIDSRADELDWDGMMKRVHEIKPDMVFVGEIFQNPFILLFNVTKSACHSAVFILKKYFRNLL